MPSNPSHPSRATSAFGETMTWDDGVTLAVSAPEPYTPSDFAVGATRANNVVFTLTITNNSTADLPLLPLPALSSGDQEVSQIFDIGSDVFETGDDVGFPPAETIAPGRVGQLEGRLVGRRPELAHDGGGAELPVSERDLHERAVAGGQVADVAGAHGRCDRDASMSRRARCTGSLARNATR